MTMFTLPNFCRVCLKYDKNLIDLETIENEPSETLMSKLQQCVSEVEWKVFKPLLCHPCIKRLNIAYTFKKQCVQSASMLKSYVALVKEKKTESQTNPKGDSGTQNKNDLGQNAYMMLPNQKYIKIVVGPQTQNSFQNVFLNVVPTSTLSPAPPEPKNSKDTNQNVFLNINNTFQKYIPVAPAEQTPPKERNLNVSQLLTESTSEELSVEIDPTDFGLEDEGSSENDEESENGINDWEDVISSSQIISRSNGTSFNGNQKSESASKSGLYGNFVPILPKQSSEDKMEFFNSGQHFLTSTPYKPDFLCEACQKRFTSNKLLRHHIKVFHLGKFPFKCDYCYNEYILRAEYEACMNYHKSETDSSNTSITLSDFKNSLTSERPMVMPETTQQELTDLVCELCHRQFNSTSGLLRHKVRKHNQKSKKKYFIKGMKNAKCDICNREFSTQSYMQLHRKLHLRDDIGYKYKVFGKNRYMKNAEQADEEKTQKSDEEKNQKIDNQNDKSNNDDSMEIEIKDEVIIKEEEEEVKQKTDDEDDDSGSDEN